MKIGGCGIVSIIHDHPKPEISADIHYEKKRFSTDKLRESGQYFEKKHGFSVWNFTSEEWVNKRLSELTLEDDKEKTLGMVHPKRKIALIIDRPGWALDNIATQIEEKLSDEFEFKKIYQDAVDCLAAVLLLAQDCDMIHFLWRPLPTAINDDYTRNFIRNLRIDDKEFQNRYLTNKVISVGVYDHFFLDGEDKKVTLKLFSDETSIVNCYTVSSKLLYQIYNNDSEIIRKPAAIVQDGVDCSLFIPMNLERFENYKNRTIKIGWVGNSKWIIGQSELTDLKGIHTIIKPVIQELKDEGYDVELITSDRNDKMIPHSEMPEFYASIDIYVCASLCEGTPNPVLEAMACGVPVISTDVGIVKEVLGEKQKEYILSERSKDCLKNKLKNLLEHLENLNELSNENQEKIKQWDWVVMSEKFRQYFRTELQKCRED